MHEYETLVSLVAIHMLFAWGMVVIVTTNQLSLGNAGFAAIGAYAAAILNTTYHVNPWIGLLAAIAAGAVAGLVIGIPALRLRGLYLALATVGFNVVVVSYITNTPFLQGATGVYNIEGLPPQIFVPITAVVGVGLWLLMRSRIGLRMKATGTNESLAASRGIDTVRYKVIAFVIGSAITAAAGAFYGGYITYVAPGNFTYLLSFQIVLYVFIGGRTLFGAGLGAALLVALPILLKVAAGFFPSAYGLLLIIAMIFRSDGLIQRGTLPAVWRRARGLVRMPARFGSG
jgi:branched-chain amino acid transport system permease protein